MRKLALVLMAACGGGGPGGPGPANAPPVAAVAAGTTVVAGHALVVDGSGSTDPDGDALTFSWSFGDGGRGGAPRQAHVFAAAGSFTVTLTVSDGRGGVDEARQTVTVTAAPPPTATVTATVRVTAAGGTPVAGASVQVRGGASATTDGDGVAAVTIGAGAPQLLRVERDGFAAQTQVLDLPEADPYVEVVLLPLAPMLALSDSMVGGMVSGVDGARVEVPAGALVDDAGAAVAGSVDVSITPLDVVTDAAAFPGKFEGIDTAGATGTLMSWGTVAYSFSQGGRPLNLAPGRTATVELPLYAALGLDGGEVAPGDVFPLWSLDEGSGVWIQEGEGTVVSAPGSPTGMALRAEVGHFSWWNADKFTLTHQTSTKCCIDSNFDGECDGDTICYVRGRTDCPSAYCNAAKPSDAPRPPAYSGTAVIDAAGTKSLPMPVGFPVFLEGFADNGQKYGFAVVYGTTSDATILLHAVDQPLPTQMIALPFRMTYATGPAGTYARYTFDGAEDDPLEVSVVAAEATTLAGVVTLLSPRGEALRAATFTTAPGRFSLRLPQTGRYTLEVNPYAGEPGGYTLEVGLAEGGLTVTDRSPAPDATGVSTTVPVVVTFSDDLNPGTIGYGATFRLLDPAGQSVPGSIAVDANVARFTPTAPLTPGLGYRVSLTTAIKSAGNVPLAVDEEWTFYTAEVLGTVARLGDTYNGSGAAAGDESFVVAATQTPNLVAYRYVAGRGWSPASILDEPQPAGAYTIGPPTVAAGGDGVVIVVWTRNKPTHAIYASVLDPAGGWSAPAQVADLPSDPREMHAVVDGQGHAIVTWSVDAAGAVTARRWAGSWGDAVTLADSGFFQHHLAVNATGQAAVLLQVANKVAVARFDGAAWEATEDLGVASSASFSDAVGLDAAGDIFILNGGSVAGAVRRWDATTRAWGLDHAIKNGCHSLAVSPVGTAMVTQCQYSSYLGSTGIVVDHWNGAAWDAPQTLQADYASSLVFRAYPTAIDRFVLFWYEGTYGVTFNHWGTLEAGVWAASPDTTTLWASNKSTAFLVSPENKVAIVGGRQSMLGLWAERLR